MWFQVVLSLTLFFDIKFAGPRARERKRNEEDRVNIF